MAKPDYEVTVKGKGEKYGARVGAAWKNEHGGINIKLKTGVALIAGDHYISLWPPKDFKDKQDDSGDYDDSGF